MKDLSNFDWGWMDTPSTQTHLKFRNGIETPLNEFHKNSIISEIFEGKIYEQIYQVKEGDVVVDIGASVGPFTYSILDKNPKIVYCLEPSISEFKTITKNLPFDNVTLINKGISYNDSVVKSNFMFGGEDEFDGTKFSSFIKDNNIDYINFLKTDCEGGEYHIFMDENMDFLLNKVGCIVGEWHLNTEPEQVEFRYFRDKYLKQFKTVEVRSWDGVDIKWELYNEHFVEYYNQVILHISNK
jgi:FkbM family methyltransferase